MRLARVRDRETPRPLSYLIVLAVLGGLSLFPLALPSSFSIDTGLDPRFTSIPLQIGDWVGKDEKLDERTYEILETRNVLARIYENQGKGRVELLLVGSNKDRRVAHPPEVCYTSSHYEVVDSKQTSIKVSGRKIPVIEFVAKDQRNLDHREYVLYVYKVGARFTTNYYAQQLKFAWDRLTRQEPEVLLIRLSATTNQVFQEFLSQILPHLS